MYKYKVIGSGYKPLCYIDDKLLIYKNLKFYLMDLKNYSVEYITELKEPFYIKLLSKNRLFVRLLRFEPRVGIELNKNIVVISFKGGLYSINLKEKKIELFHKLRSKMSNPLSISFIKNLSGFEDQICYGEYFTNHSKEEVAIYSYILKENKWKKKYSFSKGKINHIHAIVQDKYRNRVWILTGDFGEAAAIYYTDDDFKNVKEFFKGKQIFRACVFTPLKNGIIYATDSPDEQNSINFIEIETKKIKKLYFLNGSCIFGWKNNEDMYFSTTIEPYISGKFLLDLISYKKAMGIKDNESQIIKWNKEEGFKIILKEKKDIYPMGLFQFGTFIFPVGKNNNSKVICYGNSLKRVDGKLIEIER